ncbi:endolytic peptidoglycan transglycosylase RlpA [Erwinia tracheiphila]|uniref:Endolytic peptidoglycan transglycosylase RlpA n=1 Tax=Erwinia tracheiphila TaxID=65700 RepID=A0A345CP47_9GAMM|nr:endolytic peptidoglycan transglycosylase RlpA [Erwinia tracheiphila]AXF75214.1 endolytic peptidoglycan transglycosylase RlpA [Erwinia tracheiphila]UIA82238.1 endolytic peptidoglycan transglycosylase RlpA [Erwinia tracheiphila]UIA90835.1 endolytic peptidoglycan transglycosylase RlpA [Erwinia tracheiphila]
MRKDWLWISLAAALLTACSTTEQQMPAPQQPAYNGPVVEIGGVEPRYEPPAAGANQDYSVNGKKYRIVKEPSNFSETGLATWYGDEAKGNRTASGEQFDPEALTAAHPTLPIPGYVRVTNLANGRQLVVRINDRGPYTAGRVIDLSKAAGDRLNISNNTRVKVDYISVAPDGSLSGPGTIGTRVAKQSYALPPRPDIGGGMVVMGAGAASGAQSVPAQQEEAESHPIDNRSLSNENNMGAPVNRNGFLGAPQPLRNGGLEGSESVAAATATESQEVHPAAVAVSPATAPASRATPGGTSWAVQVGAVSDPARARQLLNTLSKKFGVSGTVENHNNVYRVQLGHFSSRQQASVLQQRLSSEVNQSSFITAASDKM